MIIFMIPSDEYHPDYCHNHDDDHHDNDDGDNVNDYVDVDVDDYNWLCPTSLSIDHDDHGYHPTPYDGSCEDLEDPPGFQRVPMGSRGFAEG